MAQTVNVILLDSSDDVIVVERIGSGAIIPGMLLSVNSSDVLVVHPTAKGVNERLFADVDMTVAGGIDTEYVSGSMVRAVRCEPGMRVNAWVPAGAEALTIGMAVESNGDGTIRKSTNQTVLTAATATVTGAANGNLIFTASAALPGVQGNSVQIVVATAGTFGVTISGNTITLTPETAETAAQTKVRYDALVAPKNMATIAYSGTGAGLPGTSAGVNLSGGVDANYAGGNVGFVTKAVNNSGGGTRARCQIRVA